MAIFNDPPKGHRSRIGLHYGNPERAKETIKRLRKEPRGYQYRAAQSMYVRAKYHARQTNGMRKSMKLYKGFLRSLCQTKKVKKC
jgi:hypothetical protein